MVPTQMTTPTERQHDAEPPGATPEVSADSPLRQRASAALSAEIDATAPSGGPLKAIH